MQSIVFVGNCQIQAISNLYQSFAWQRGDQILTYVPSYEDLNPAAAAEIVRADIIVEQVFDVAPKAQTEGLNPDARRVLVPLVGCNFLWPFAGAPRVHNPVRPFLSAGLFPAEAGISFLDRMIRNGTDPELAVEAFLGYDVPARHNLDRLYEISQDRQRRRDEMTGFGFAALIERHFRDERLFLSVYHPETRIAVELAALTFERMGVDRSDIDRMRRAIRRTPFPAGELPIHPAVARHFGLRYLPQEPRFAFLNEGRLSFRDIALRYMRCEWNEQLEEGVYRVKQGEWEAGAALLSSALVRSPDSAIGYAMLGRALLQTGHAAAAVEALETAIQLDPDDPRVWSDLAAARRAAGDTEGAEAAFRHAIELDPWDAHHIALLAHLLHAERRIDAAAGVLAEGLEVNDRAAKLHLEMAFVREAQADWASAVRSYETALSLDPTLRAADRLAAARAQVGKVELVALANQARSLREAGAHEEAAEHLKRVVALAPDDVEGKILLGETLSRAGHHSDAAAVLEDACRLRPGNPYPWLLLGDTRLNQGDAVAAEAALRTALSLDEQGHGYFLLTVALERQGRFADAVQSGQRMVALDPHSPHRHLQLGLVGMRGGNAAGTEASLQRAFELAPDEPRFLLELSDALMHAGFDEQAVQAARRAVCLAPDDAGLRANLVRKLAQSGGLEEAQAIAGHATIATVGRSVTSIPKVMTDEDRTPYSVVVFDGDSISAGDGAGAGHGLDSAFIKALGAPARVYNAAAGGRPVLDCLLRFDRAVSPLHDPHAGLNLIVFHAGDNDLNMGSSARQVYAFFARYVALAHAGGWKVVVSTEMPRPDFPAPRAAELAAYNRFLRQNAAGADVVVDFNADPRFGDATERAGSALFADSLHPNDAGYAILGRYLADSARHLFAVPAATDRLVSVHG